jgi:hypothetical protein
VSRGGQSFAEGRQVWTRVRVRSWRSPRNGADVYRAPDSPAEHRPR